MIFITAAEMRGTVAENTCHSTVAIDGAIVPEALRPTELIPAIATLSLEVTTDIVYESRVG